MIDCRTTYYHLLALFVLAIGLRFLYLALATDNIGFDAMTHGAADTQHYLSIRDHLISWHPKGSNSLLLCGPGYGVILATIKTLFGPHLIWPVVFGILMGGLAPVFIYLLSLQLFESRAISLLAGGFSAVSLTSISLSCQILTDQPFFTFQVASLFCFVSGCRSRSNWWFLLSGLLAGSGALVRPMGQIWPLVVVAFLIVLPLPRLFSSRGHFMRSAAITLAVMLIMMGSWTLRNYAIHDLPVFGTNGVRALRSFLVAQSFESSRGEKHMITKYRDQWEIEDGDFLADQKAAYNNARQRVVDEFKVHPSLMMTLFWENLLENMTAPNAIVEKQVPPLSQQMAKLNQEVMTWLGYWIIYLTIAGLVIMAIRGFLFSAWILGLTYLAFSIPIGTSFWQGSRLHYQAEMAWSIVIAYLVVELFRFLRTGTNHLIRLFRHTQLKFRQ